MQLLLEIEISHWSGGVLKSIVLDAGLGPSGPVATTLTVYVVPGLAPLNLADGVALVTTMGAPPPTGVAVKV